MRGLERASLAGAIVVLGAAFPVVACTDGTTPDCSSPEAGCGPENTGGGNDDAATPIEASLADADAAHEADTSAPPGDGGASLDADASHD